MDSKNLLDGDQQAPVPVFNCVVYLSQADGKTQAKVMNLEGLECTANSEREAMAQLIPEFKRKIAKLHESSGQIPWVEEFPEPARNQQRRLVPVHL